MLKRYIMHEVGILIPCRSHRLPKGPSAYEIPHDICPPGAFGRSPSLHLVWMQFVPVPCPGAGGGQSSRRLGAPPGRRLAGGHHPHLERRRCHSGQRGDLRSRRRRRPSPHRDSHHPAGPMPAIKRASRSAGLEALTDTILFLTPAGRC